jgi:hypothetical protein
MPHSSVYFFLNSHDFSEYRGLTRSNDVWHAAVKGALTTRGGTKA